MLLSRTLNFVAILVELSEIASALLLLLAPTDPAAPTEPTAEHHRTECDQPD
jgi:hypothetical protein